MPRGQKLQTAIPGFGFIFRPTYKYKGENRQQSVWWMSYEALDGEEVRVSTKERDQRRAYEMLQQEHDRRRRGEIGTACAELVTIGQLLDAMLDQYRGNATFENQKQQVEKHIRPEWGDKLAIRLTGSALKKWCEKLDAGTRDEADPTRWHRRPLSDASINRLLSSLHQALVIGTEGEPPLVRHIPAFPWRVEDNARQGIISRAMYEKVRDLLPSHAQLAFVIGYHTGLRKGVILSLRWDWVNWDKGVISIPEPAKKARKLRAGKKPKETKVKPRHVPIWGEMRAYLEMAREIATTEYIVEFRGQRVRGIRTAWETARRMAKAPTSLFHDLRRTAATMMHDELKLSRADIMTIVGWKSEAMFDRYHIGSEEHAASLGKTLDARMAQKFGDQPVSIRERTN
jgi:integrase